MKILLTGSEGLLGQYLSSVFGGDTLLQFSHSDLDITNFDSVDSIIKGNSPDIVINTASNNNVDAIETEEGFKKATIVNGYAVENLANAVKSIDGIFIHFSTDYVFDGNRATGFLETDVPHPINNYGKTKLLGEQLIQQKLHKFYIIRMSRLFGNTGKSAHSKKNFVDIMLDSTKGNEQIRVVADETSSPTYALDASNAVKDILSNKRPFGIYHVTNSGHCTWHEFAKKIFEIYKKIDEKTKIPELIPVSTTEFSRKAKRPRFSMLLNTKIPSLRQWDVALEEYIKTKYL